MKSIFDFDILTFLSTLFLIIIGVFFIFSSGVSSDGEIVSNEYIRQILWIFSGLILLFIFIYIDYKIWNSFAYYIYAFSIFILIITLVFGKTVNGAKSWLGIGFLGVQPSEFAKISVIIFLSKYLVDNRRNLKRVSTVLKAFAFTVIPVVLILAQPDLGTALVYIPIFLFMTYAAGAEKRHILFIFLTGFLLLLFTIMPFWKNYFIDKTNVFVDLLSNEFILKYLLISFIVMFVISVVAYLYVHKKYYYWISYFSLIIILGLLGSSIAKSVLKEYQIMRLIVFLNPQIDPKGAGWNIIQSITAVGSGGLFGKGFLQGTQSHYRYLPQQSTDFIFSIISEEIGFFGCLFVYLLFLVIFIRAIVIAIKARDDFSALLAIGIAVMFFFHLIVNTGMAMGIMPITGIPLFFLSYGGSSLWTSLISVGILLNIHSRRYMY